MSEETIRIATYEGDRELSAGGREKHASTSFGRLYAFPDDDPQEAETQLPPVEESVPKGFKIHEVSADIVEAQLVRLAQTLDRSLSRVTEQADLNAIELADAEIAIAIAANGTVCVLGLGAGVAGATTLKLRFKPKTDHG